MKHQPGQLPTGSGHKSQPGTKTQASDSGNGRRPNITKGLEDHTGHPLIPEDHTFGADVKRQPVSHGAGLLSSRSEAQPALRRKARSLQGVRTRQPGSLIGRRPNHTKGLEDHTGHPLIPEDHTHADNLEHQPGQLPTGSGKKAHPVTKAQTSDSGNGRRPNHTKGLEDHTGHPLIPEDHTHADNVEHQPGQLPTGSGKKAHPGIKAQTSDSGNGRRPNHTKGLEDHTGHPLTPEDHTHADNVKHLSGQLPTGSGEKVQFDTKIPASDSGNGRRPNITKGLEDHTGHPLIPEDHTQIAAVTRPRVPEDVPAKGEHPVATVRIRPGNPGDHAKRTNRPPVLEDHTADVKSLSGQSFDGSSAPSSNLKPATGAGLGKIAQAS